MFHDAIVGVDGSPGGRDAIALARLLVDADGRLTLANIRAHEVPPPGGAAELAGRGDSERLLEAERAATEVEAELVSLADRSVGRGLHALAEGRGSDLLVVGSCRRGIVGRVLVGNDTRAALNGSPCAIAVAPVAYARNMDALRTIGVAYDGSPESDAALAIARALGARYGATLRALRVVPLPGSPWGGFGGTAWGDTLEDLVADAQRGLSELAGVEGEARLGIAGEELAAFGERVDLLVVGSRGYGPLRRLMLGSTSEYLAGHARCPLLVLPRVAIASAGGEHEDTAAR